MILLAAVVNPLDVPGEVEGADPDQRMKLDLVIGVGVPIPGHPLCLGLSHVPGWGVFQPDTEDTRD